MEIKSHCEKIKRIIGTSRLSNAELTISGLVLSSSDESVVYECFGSIVAIAQNSAPLEQNTLDDFLITCHSIRRNQPKLADKVALLMSQAKTLIEDLVVTTVSDTQATGANQPSTIIESSVPSSKNVSDSGNSSVSSVVLSQHGTMSTTTVFLQDMLHQYDLARVAGNASGSIPMIANHNTVPPPIQVTTVQSGPPPLQVTTAHQGPSKNSPNVQTTETVVGSSIRTSQHDDLTSISIRHFPTQPTKAI